MQFCSSCVRKHCCLEHGFRGGSRLKFESLSARHLDTYSKLIVLMPRKGNLLQRSPASMLRGIIGSPAPFEGVRRKFESFRSNNLRSNAWFRPTVLMRRWEFSGKLWIKVYKLFEFCIISNASSWRVNTCLLVLWQLAVDDEDVGASIKRSLSSERLSILRCRNALTVD